MIKKRIIFGISLIIVAVLIVVINWDFFKPQYTDIKFWVYAISVLILLFLALKPLVDKFIDKYLK